MDNIADSGQYWISPANKDLTSSEVTLLKLPGKETRLRTGLYEVDNDFDFILLDSPPAINMLTVNALVASQ